MSTLPDGDWPSETRPLVPAPPPPPGVPPDDEPANRIGLGMLLGIVVLAAAGAALAAILLTRHHSRNAAPTTVVVTTAPASTATAPTTTAAKAAKLILPVPDLVGQQWKDAAAGLRHAGFHVTLVTVPSALPRGAVTAQDPKAGTKVAKGSDIRLNVSSGAKQGTATTAEQSTAAATTAAQSTSATTTSASTGETTTAPSQPTNAEVPSLSGDLRSALEGLDGAGLAASIAYVPSTQPLGTVVAQTPAGGETARAGSQVTINVSSGPNGAADHTVPNVVGQRIPQALDALHAAGLRLILLRKRVDDRSQAGVIVAQTPLAGKRAPKNAQVLVYMGAYRQQ